MCVSSRRGEHFVSVGTGLYRAAKSQMIGDPLTEIEISPTKEVLHIGPIQDRRVFVLLHGLIQLFVSADSK